ncbi:MAG: hypothetical protein QOJ02_3039 [Acidobacteriota bacterium]|nr:hypothetical protein [Acidobacteriota bacterium]
MKRCPSCQRTYTDDSLAFCLEDGSALLSERADASDLPATVIMPDPRMTNHARPETFRPNPTPTQAHPPQQYTAPPPHWPPHLIPQAHPTSTARQGRGAAITSLICAISAFLLLAFCIISGARGADASLIGGIFIFSALIGLLGAVLGIVAAVKTGKDTNPQNSKVMAVVALVLNGIYLVIVVIFLVLGAIASSR